MPSLAELQQEEVWQDEYVPHSIGMTRTLLLNAWGWEGWRIGTIGDEKHLNGYHRSRNWIQRSRHCTNRTYSVTETSGNRNGGDGRQIAAMDFVTTEAFSRTIHTRLTGAKNAGRLPFVRQVILESGPWHVHVSFDRGALNFNPQIFVDAITGQNAGGQRMITVRATMPELRQGAEGRDVVTWQTLANLRGAQLKVDGEFGPLTHEGTKDVQREFGAEAVDGIVGPETWGIGLAGADQE